MKIKFISIFTSDKHLFSILSYYDHIFKIKLYITRNKVLIPSRQVFKPSRALQVQTQVNKEIFGLSVDGNQFSLIVPIYCSLFERTVETIQTYLHVYLLLFCQYASSCSVEIVYERYSIKIPETVYFENLFLINPNSNMNVYNR